MHRGHPLRAIQTDSECLLKKKMFQAPCICFWTNLAELSGLNLIDAKNVGGIDLTLICISLWEQGSEMLYFFQVNPLGVEPKLSFTSRKTNWSGWKRGDWRIWSRSTANSSTIQSACGQKRQLRRKLLPVMMRMRKRPRRTKKARLRRWDMSYHAQKLDLKKLDSIPLEAFLCCMLHSKLPWSYGKTVSEYSANLFLQTVNVW